MFILFNIFLERIMTDTLEDHGGTVSIRDRTITNLCFEDDINGLAGEEELAKLVQHLHKASTTANGREIISAKILKKTNMMRKKKESVINKEIKVNGQKLETVTSLSSSTWAQLYLTRAPSLRYSEG